MPKPTKAEYDYWTDILQGKYANPAQKPAWLSRSTVIRAVQKPAAEQVCISEHVGAELNPTNPPVVPSKPEPQPMQVLAPGEQTNLLTGLARITVAMEILSEAWEHEKAKARAAMLGT